MPRKKALMLKCTGNLKGGQETPSEMHESNLGTVGGNRATDSPVSPPPESHPIASSSRNLSQEDTDTLNSPDGLAEGLGSLAIGVASDEDIILEDPPEDTDDPPGSRNPESLADDEADDTLPPIEAEEPEEETDENKKQNNQPIPKAEAKEMVDMLNKIILTSFHGHGRTRACSLGDVMLTRLRFMAGTLNLIVEMGFGLMDVSRTAAVVFGRKEWAARQVHVWIRAFQTKKELLNNVYGTWNESVVEDEDLSSAIQEWLRDKGKYIRAHDMVDFFETPAAVAFSYLIDSPPSVRTAQRWMHHMGYTWMKERCGQFADGHERDDIVDYRMNYYIPEWIKLEQLMRSWDSDGNEVTPELKEGERVVVVWFHDESTFYAHDQRLTRWVHESEKSGIYKKGEGVSLMVADFISADYRWLRLRPEPLESVPADGHTVEGENFNDAQVIFHAGKAQDGWFGTADVIKQLSRTMSIVKRQYPNEDHVFVFDNATIHTKLPESTPNANKMTLGPSQKVQGEEIGPSGEKIKVDYAPAVLPNGMIQQFYHPLDHPVAKLCGTFKGIAQILEERGVEGARKLKLVCPAIDSQKGQGCLPGATNCCACCTIMNQPDFLSQKSILQNQAEAKGFSVMYLPKYHCELNPIEQCWGAAKWVYQESPPSSTEADLRRNMLVVLESVKLGSIRRFAARSQQFVHAYHLGLSGSQAAWAAKCYRGHRIIPDSILEAMDKESIAQPLWGICAPS